MAVCPEGHLQQAGGHQLAFRKGTHGSLVNQDWLPSVLQEGLMPASCSTAIHVPGRWRGMELDTDPGLRQNQTLLHCFTKHSEAVTQASL